VTVVELGESMRGTKLPPISQKFALRQLFRRSG